MTLRNLTGIFLPFVILCLCQHSFADVLDELAPGHWHHIKDSNLDSVVPRPVPPGSTGVKSVMGSWSGGAYDTNRDRLIVWGGGHTNYAGNEIYTFALDTLTWKRFTEPSSLVDWTNGDTVYSDTRPVSRHTYDYIEYIPPPFDYFFISGGSGLWKSGHNDSNTYTFDFVSKTWTTLDRSVPSAGLFNGIGAISARDPATNKVWYHDAGKNSILSEFDPHTSTWTARGTHGTEPDGWIKYTWTGALDPVRRKFVAIGNGQVYVWDLNKDGFIANTKLLTTGDIEILDKPSPGFAYDPVRDQFVAWYSGPHVYTLDMDSAEWTEETPAATNAIDPGVGTAAGVFGRFRYIPSKNLYILVNRATEDVYFYRLTAAKSQTVPHKPAQPSAVLKVP